MPIRQDSAGSWFFGSKGPFETRKKAEEVMRGMFASGYTGKSMHKIIKSIDNFLAKQKIYLKPGERPPKGVTVQRGTRGGTFYTPSSGSSAKGPSSQNKFAPGQSKINRLKEYARQEASFPFSVGKDTPQNIANTKVKAAEVKNLLDSYLAAQKEFEKNKENMKNWSIADGAAGKLDMAIRRYANEVRRGSISTKLEGFSPEFTALHSAIVKVIKAMDLLNQDRRNKDYHNFFNRSLKQYNDTKHSFGITFGLL